MMDEISKEVTSSTEYHYLMKSTPTAPEDLISYTCDKCPRVFANPSVHKAHARCHNENFQRHMSSAYVLLQKVNVKCQDLLAFQMSRACVLLENVTIFECDGCTRGFLNQEEFNLHQLKHIEYDLNYSSNSENDYSIKKFKCEKCCLRFVAASTLNSHSILHEPFPHICHCGIGFYSSKDLSGHKKIVHPENNVALPNLIETKENIPANREYAVSKTKSSIGPRLKAELKLKSNKNTKFKYKSNPNNRFSEEQFPDLDIKIDETGEYKCPTCSESFKNKILLIAHYLGHQGVKRDVIKHFSCQYCLKSFKAKRNREIHERIHTGVKPYTCHICDSRFTQSGSLKLHLLRHAGFKKEQCQYCDKTFVERGNLKIHERTHTGVKPYECKYCKKCFSDPSAHKRHERTHSGVKPYECEHCGMRFSDASGLIRHRMTHNGIKKFSCDICDKKFYTAFNVRKHLTVHTLERNYQCNECGKCFSAKNNLGTHIKVTHLNEKRFTCGQCNKQFSSKNNMMKHYECVHEKKRLYKCNECDKRFNMKQNLKNHRAKIHDVSRSFLCNDCPHQYATKSELIRHILTKHPTVKCDKCARPFICSSDLEKHKTMGCVKCDICNKTFRWAKTRNKHYNTCHVKQTKCVYDCNECGKRFMAKTSFRYHYARHHGDWRKFQCDYCNETFALRSDILMHIQNKHMESLYCHICHKRFYSEHDFNRHRKKKCTFFKIPCEICNRLFHNKYELNEHLLATHIGIRKYECDSCGKKFGRKYDIRRHIKFVQSCSQPKYTRRK